MTVLYTRLGCKVETTFHAQPNGRIDEHVTLSVDRAGAIELAPEEPPGQFIGERAPGPRERSRGYR